MLTKEMKKGQRNILIFLVMTIFFFLLSAILLNQGNEKTIMASEQTPEIKVNKTYLFEGKRIYDVSIDNGDYLMTYSYGGNIILIPKIKGNHN